MRLRLRTVLSYSLDEMEVTALTSAHSVHAEIDDHTHRSAAVGGPALGTELTYCKTPADLTA